jgi:hypothetical protein
VDAQSPPDQLSVLAESINQQLSLCGKAIDHIRIHQSEKEPVSARLISC